jgi:hypothetical protein
MMERPRDEIWDAITEHFGEPRTKSERGRRNRAVRELREAGATAEEVSIVIEYCQRNFTSYTEMALCSWLTRALKEAESRSNVRELFLRKVSER